MDEKLQKKLQDRFPVLYQEIDQPGSIMSYGLAVADSWFDLLWKLSEDLEKLDPELVASQVKEKFGALSFYVRQADLAISENIQPADMISFAPVARNEAVRARIQQANADSATVCERCGAPGKLRKGGYISVRCDACQVVFDTENRARYGEDWDLHRDLLLQKMDTLGDAADEIRGSYERALLTVADEKANEEQLDEHVCYLLKQCRKLQEKLDKKGGGDHG